MICAKMCAGVEGTMNHITSLHNGNKSIYAGDTSLNNQQKNSMRTGMQDGNQTQSQVKNGTVFTGNINKLQQDSILNKKLMAHKQAMKAIVEQFTSDQETDTNLDTRRAHQEELVKEAGKAQEELTKIKADKEQLKENYKVDDSSREQKNLELLEKMRDNPKNLTSEEMDQLEYMGPMTDYQKASLELDERTKVWQKLADNALATNAGEDKAIQAIGLSRLKSAPMIQAEELATDIIDSASKEVVGTLLAEAKDHVEEEMEKKVDDAEKKAEEKEEEDQKLEKAKEENKLNDQSTDQTTKTENIDSTDTDTIQKVSSDQLKLQNELKQLVKKENLLEDDAMGIVVDEFL